MKLPFQIPNLTIPDGDTKFIVTGKVVAYGCIALALLGLTVPLILGYTSFALMGSYLAIPMLIAPLVYLRLKPVAPGDETQMANVRFLSLAIVYTVLFTCSVLLLYLFDVRPMAYYILVTLMGICVIMEIMGNNTPSRNVAILLQLIFFFLNLEWGVSLKYFFFIARTDPIGHAWMIENVARTGYVSAAVFGEYQQFPLWHIFCAMAYEMSGIIEFARQMMFLLNGIVYAVVILFVFLIAKKILRDDKFALVAALFAVFNPGVIAYGMTSIPRSAVLLLMLVIIWLLLSMDSLIHSVLIILLTFSAILYHTVSMPFIVMVLLIMYVLQVVYAESPEQRFLRFPVLVIMSIMTLVYWMFFASYMFRIVVFNVLSAAPTKLSIGSVLSFPLTELFNYLQYLPLLFFLLMGILYALGEERGSFMLRIFCLTGLLMIPAVFPGPALLIGKLAANFNISRFEEYAFLFISVAAAAGFLYLYHRSRKYGQVVLIIVFAVMCTLMISNDFVASDNPLVKRPFYTFSLSRSEITSFDHVAAMQDGNLILSDYVTTRYYMDSPYRYNSTVMQVKVSTGEFLENESADVMIVRTGEMNGRPVKLIKSYSDTFLKDPDYSALDFYYKEDPIWNTLNREQRFYDSGVVVAYG